MVLRQMALNPKHSGSLTPEFAQSADGSDIAVYETGFASGPPLLFLHGFGFDYRVWRKQLFDPQLSERFRMIAFDLRGHGVSAKPSTLRAYSGLRWAEDLDAVLKMKSLSHPTIVAWSFGGRTLNHFLTQNPGADVSAINYVAAATLSDTDLAGPRFSLMRDLASDESDVALAAADAIVREVFLGRPGTAEYAEYMASIAVIPQHIRVLMRAHPFSFDAMLAKLSIPVLVSHGQRDAFVKWELANRVATTVRAGRPSLYKEAGHAVFFEHPERFNRELADLCCTSNLGRADARCQRPHLMRPATSN
jgi:non-heme chloroperoxidase